MNKKCSKCGLIKSDDAFSKNKKYADGLQSYCKMCMKEYSSDWDKNHPEKRKSTTDKWRSANSERVIELSRKWNLSHPEKKREINKTWQDNHPEQVKAADRLRKERERTLGKDISESEKEQLKQDYAYHCAYCGKELPLELDHVIPLSKGGKNDISNRVPSCKKCNAKKNSNSLLFFMYRIFIKEAV